MHDSRLQAPDVDMPTVAGRLPLDDRWVIEVPEPLWLQRGTAELSLWRPGLTIWFQLQPHSTSGMPEDAMETLRRRHPPDAYDQTAERDGALVRMAYRQRDGAFTGKLDALWADVISDGGCLSLHAAALSQEDLDVALAIWKSARSLRSEAL